MKSFLFVLLSAIAFSLSACSTAPKKECCSTTGTCCTDSKGAHKH